MSHGPAASAAAPAPATVHGDAPRLKHFVAGAWRNATSDHWVDDINPSDAADLVARVPEGSEEDVRAAVTAAAEAFQPWRRLSGPARAEYLHKWAAAIADRHEEIAQTMAREVGKPIAEARGETTRCVMILRYYAGEAVRSIGDVIPAQTAGALQFSLREPLGVVALITPWNFPVAIPLWKAAPAIAFGNTVVLKPAEAASRMATLLGETAAAAGLPAGVFNVVLGKGSKIGNALINAPEVRAVSFTGSNAVGMQIAAAAAARNIRYQTEMGGKNVAIVLADADLVQAATLTAGGAFRYAGQKCTATSRVVVAREVEDAFHAELQRQVAALPLGPVTDASAAIGPVIGESTREQLRKVLAGVDGAHIFVGAAVPKTDEFARGFFYSPTVVRGVDADSDLAQRELFGPVLAALSADDLEHAIALANGTPYGLSASLFTRDIRSALRYVDRIEAGLVRVNGDTTGVDPHAPFGGMKGSSSGSREQGPAAREFYTEIKTVQVNP
jgi:acyl-CoA reductase-like NAD-dependent aldehyde dehydrogenase